MDGKFYPSDFTNFFIVSDLFILTLAHIEVRRMTYLLVMMQRNKSIWIFNFFMIIFDFNFQRYIIIKIFFSKCSSIYYIFRNSRFEM